MSFTMSASMSTRAISSKGACPVLPVRRAQTPKAIRACRPVTVRAAKLSVQNKPAKEEKTVVDQWWLMGAAFTTFMAPAEVWV